MPDFPTNGVSQVTNGTGTIRFGAFEADLHSGEVRKSGSRVKLQEQPFKVLQVLLERPGALVTREELRSRIWPDESFGDFDHAVNVAVGKLRTALGDSADNPNFIETIPRRGYRFVAPLENPPVNAQPTPAAAAVISPPPQPKRPPQRVLVGFLALILAAALVGAGMWLGRRSAPPSAPEFQRLTVRHGSVFSARFAPDGHNVVYSAAWDGAPVEIYSTDTNFSGTRNLGLSGTALLAVSSSGDMAVITKAGPRFMLTLGGTLGKVMLTGTGGSPRLIAENVEWADWAPNGKDLAIVRDMAGRQRLEFPLGHVLYETTGWISHPRVSPKGDRIAFLDHPNAMDDRGAVCVVDLAGKKKVLSSGWESEEGLAWSPNGTEVWFSATETGLQRRVYAVNLSGDQRLAFRAPGGVTLEDIAPDGRVLLTRDEHRAGIMGLAPGATRERDLSWLDWSLPTDLSADGKTVLLDEEGDQSGSSYTVATRDIYGSPPVPLGEGMAGGFSPDGKWAASTVDYSQIVLLPTGAGTARRLDRGDIQQYGHPVRWLADGKQILFPAIQGGHELRCFVQNVDGGKPRPVTPYGVSWCQASPDGKFIAAEHYGGNDGLLYPIDGGEPKAIPGLLPGETFSWTEDPKFMWVNQWRQPLPIRIYRLNLETGQRQLFKEVTPSDVTGLCDIRHIRLSADGRGYIYGYVRLLSDLYQVKGLR